MAVSSFQTHLNTDETNTNLNHETLNMEDEILRQATALKEMIRIHYAAGGSLLKPIWLDFGDTEDESGRIKPDEKEDDLDKPSKEAFRSPFSRRIVQYTGKKYTMSGHLRLYDGATDPDHHLTRFSEAGQQGEWPMPVWCRMFQQTLDGVAQGWFSRLEPRSIDNWEELREQFITRFSLCQKGVKDPTEITKILLRANETLPEFKERWTDEAS